MRMTSESDERMITINGEDSPSADDANIKGNVGGNGSLKKGPWTTAEDAILIEYVTKHGEGNWNAVQKHSGLARCGKSCRLRWANHLRPDLKKGAFTPEEERRIIELHAKMGNKWARMAAELPGRTDNEIKNYWNTRIKRRQRAGLSIYPDELTHLRSSNENQQNDDMNNFSSGNVHNHSDFMSINNFEIPSVEFKNLELNHHIYTPGLLDFPAGNLLDIPPTSLLAQGLNSSYHNKSLLPTVHPSKRLRGSETFFHGLNPSTCNAFTGGCQYISDSPMQIDKSSVLSAYDHNSVDDHATSSCLPSGSHAVLNGNPSSEPAWAMKVELPSLQTQMGTWASPSPSSPFFDSVDILIQTPPNEHVQLCNLSPQNSGLLDAVLYESETMKTSKSIAIQQTPHMDINSANVHHEIEWEAYNEQLSPLGHSSSSVFSESTLISGTSLDEPYSAGVLPVREEASNLVQVQYDDKVETKNQIFSRPDFLLASNCFGRMKHHPKDHSLLKDAIGSFLGDELSNDCKNMDTGATPSAQSHGHNSGAWNTMPTV